MSLLDALSGKISKHNDIKMEGMKFLFSCADEYEKNSYFYDHYRNLALLYSGYCLYLFNGKNTPSYKKNIQNVDYEYILKYMVSVNTCELLQISVVLDILSDRGLSGNDFVKIIADDCKFSIEEHNKLVGLLSDYNSIDSVRLSSLLGFTKHYYTNAIKADAPHDEIIAISLTDKFIRDFYFKASEQLHSGR